MNKRETSLVFDTVLFASDAPDKVLWFLIVKALVPWLSITIFCMCQLSKCPIMCVKFFLFKNTLLL